MKIASTFSHESIQGFKFGSTPFGKPRLFSHVYFVDGMLLDTGHSNMQKEVLKSLTPLRVEQIFLTHHHEDHTGNLAQLQAYFDCPAHAHSLCVEMMKTPPKISFAQWLTWGDRPPNFHLQPEDNFIETPNHRFELIHTPGHAVDMVCLYESQQGWLFSADLWVSSYIRYFMRSESMKQQIESIHKILQLDFDVLLCSHNPQFTDGKEKLRKKLQFLEDFYGKAAKFHHQGHSPSSIMKEMGLKESWFIRFLSTGELSTLNMVKSVVRDEGGR